MTMEKICKEAIDKYIALASKISFEIIKTREDSIEIRFFESNKNNGDV